MARKKIRTKQTVSITIDTEVYLKIRLEDKINLSGLINDFLKQHFSSENDNIEELKAEQEEAKKKLVLIEYELGKIEANKEKEQQLNLSVEQEDRRKLIASIPAGRDFYSKLQREKMLREHPELKSEIEKLEEAL